MNKILIIAVATFGLVACGTDDDPTEEYKFNKENVCPNGNVTDTYKHGIELDCSEFYKAVKETDPVKYFDSYEECAESREKLLCNVP